MPMLTGRVGMAGEQASFRGPVDVLRQRHRALGVRGCYRGMTATLLRETPSYGAYFVAYEVRPLPPYG
jgi:solute carrier family 25 (mitochondrial carnitine/acylcarnitine transporter), member 20/29